MSTTHDMITVRGHEVYELRGGTGRPLLYLHSAMGEVDWLPHLVALSERYELHIPAHPGFKSSIGIEHIRDIEDMAYHYLAYLDGKGWDAVDIVGLSLGGWIAAEIAARWPERVSKLVLTDAVGVWIPDRPIADIFATRFDQPEKLVNLFFYDDQCPIFAVAA